MGKIVIQYNNIKQTVQYSSAYILVFSVIYHAIMFDLSVILLYDIFIIFILSINKLKSFTRLIKCL